MSHLDFSLDRALHFVCNHGLKMWVVSIKMSNYISFILASSLQSECVPLI